MNQVNLCLRRDSITKTLPWGTRISFPTKVLKEVAILIRNLGAILV